MINLDAGNIFMDITIFGSSRFIVCYAGMYEVCNVFLHNLQKRAIRLFVCWLFLLFTVQWINPPY